MVRSSSSCFGVCPVRRRRLRRLRRRPFVHTLDSLGPTNRAPNRAKARRPLPHAPVGACGHVELSVLSCFDLVFSDQDTAGLTLPQATLPQPLAKVDRQYRRVFRTGSKHGNMDQDTPWNGLRVYLCYRVSSNDDADAAVEQRMGGCSALAKESGGRKERNFF